MLTEAIPVVPPPMKPTTRVSKAAKWLDENHPRWYYKVTAKNLDMSRGDRCVAGLVTGNHLAYEGFAFQILDKVPFGPDNGTGGVTRGAIRRAWLQEVEYRKALDIVNEK